jgi:hypothetical protein
VEESASGKTLRIWIEHKHVSVQARVMDTCKLVKNKKHVKPRLPSVRSIGRHVCSLAFAIISIEKGSWCEIIQLVQGVSMRKQPLIL